MDPNGSDSKDIRHTVKSVIWFAEIGKRQISVCRSAGGGGGVQLGVAVK